jgi:type I restriction enzyme M protein
VTSHLSQRELESYLWGAATLLRGLIDASDYKQYIFPLLLFKRLSDVWDEDHAEAFAETKDEGYAAAMDTRETDRTTRLCVIARVHRGEWG